MSLEELVRGCEEVVAVLDEVARVLDVAEGRLRRCSWRLSSLKDLALKVEEAEGISLNEARLDVAAIAAGRASAKLLKLSERVEKASIEVKAFIVECARLARGAQPSRGVGD